MILRLNLGQDSISKIFKLTFRRDSEPFDFEAEFKSGFDF